MLFRFERVKKKQQFGNCLHCHASVLPAWRKLGGGDAMKGFEEMCPLPFAEARKLVSHPVTCLDCHDPKTMALRVTRPGFLRGIAAFKKSQGVDNYDPNTVATRQEMRSFVCGQCHVEYYFKGPEKRLPRRNRRASAQGAAPGVRDVEPGHPRALGGRLRR